MQAAQVWEAFRRWGHLQAQLDPLGRLRPAPHEELDEAVRSGPSDTVARARAAYCGSIGAEFAHLADPQRRRWIAERLEATPPRAEPRRILERLIRAETFERVAQTRYIGAKRYSLEGATALLPLLDEILETAAARGAAQAVLAMSHRGRLNVIVNVVGRSAAEMFAGFEDVDPRSVLGAGDVKYHLGATGDYQTQAGGVVRVHLVSNPSHLEAVNPVAMGRARAKQDRLGSRQAVLPIVIHGDSAFAGQGVVAETLNLADLPGYTVGGTLQVVVNNLIGFTTTQPNLHSSRYASDVARRLDAPVFHVNGEDPDAVVRVARLAAEYRYAFAGDVTVDLIGYRRHGHSEVDDPTVTQPICYRRVKDWPVLWESYARRIGEEQRAREIEQAVRREFEQGQLQARQATEAPVLRELPAYWANYTGGPYDRAQEVDTGVPEARLAEIGVRLASFPPAFHIHPKLVRLLEERHDMGAGRRPVDWGMAEALAFGSLLWEGRNVRMSGEDVRRGTFNHRHAVLIDTEDESEYTPLNHLHSQQGKLMIYDSCLSEMAPLGFEYGYSRDYPEALVLWEAQFGDFANGAQIIIDQFLSATEDKWDLLSAVVLLLPHGYEGQGPEHSSARLERFLQLCGEDNMQVGQPSTAAQYFHLLRRQALRRWHKPLVVMTPKSMLRNPAAMSPLASFTTGRFQPVIPDRETRDATRLLVCSGKIGHELRAERQKRKAGHVAIVFLEQFYPFPDEELAAALQEHPRARDLVWVQEEPANMGALTFVLPRIERAGERPVRSVKRSASASPATGSGKAHAIEQATLLALAFA